MVEEQKFSWWKELGFFLLKAIVYVGIYIFFVSEIFPSVYEPREIIIDDPRYAAYYDDGELPPCDTECVRIMIKDAIEESKSTELPKIQLPRKREI